MTDDKVAAAIDPAVPGTDKGVAGITFRGAPIVWDTIKPPLPNYQQSLVDMIKQIHGPVMIAPSWWRRGRGKSISALKFGQAMSKIWRDEKMGEKYYSRKRRGYHFVGGFLRYDQSVKTPADGKWLRMPAGSPRPRCCVRGYHASPQASQAEQYRPFEAKWLCYVEVEHVTSNRPSDKFAGRARKIIARMPVERFDELASRVIYSPNRGARLHSLVRAEFKRIMREARPRAR